MSESSAFVAGTLNHFWQEGETTSGRRAKLSLAGGRNYPWQEGKHQFLTRQVTELQQHIKVLQAVGLNAMEGDEGLSGANNGQAPDPAGLSQQSLETLLLAKNRHLEHELTMARLKVADLTGKPIRPSVLPCLDIHVHTRRQWTDPATACQRFAGDTAAG